MDETARLFEIFLDVQRGLPRQGPGDDDSTRRALTLCGALPARPEVLDIGCGPGMQTVALATALAGRVTAVDLHREYLDALKSRVTDAGLAERVCIVSADMNTLPFPGASFDLIWAEGSAYIMDFGAALAAWKPLLRPGGRIAVTELVWLRPDPPAEAATFFGAEYPAMTDVDTNIKTVEACGYEMLGHFTLPDSAWWTDYYTPLEAKLATLHEKYAADEKALGLIDTTKREIEIRRRFGAWYSYEFFIAHSVA